MNRDAIVESDDEMRAEYDLTGGVRGKYYGQDRQGTDVVFPPGRSGFVD